MKRTYTPTKPKRILIVDDDETVASIYQSKLQSERFEVAVASSGERALQMLAQERADLVILDFSPLGMNEPEILKAIRSQAAADALPVIVLANFYLPGVVQAALGAGATICVRKSDCTPRKLVEIVRETLATSRAIDPPARPGEISSDIGSASAPGFDPSRRNKSKTVSADFEMEYEAKLIAEFLANAPRKLGKLRTGHQALVNAKRGDECLTKLFEMRRLARLLAGAASVAGFREFARLANALEALFIKLHRKPANIMPSVIRTIAHAVDLLAALFDNATKSEVEMLPISPTILVVDDEVISREAICFAIEQADLRAVSVDDARAAERLLQETHFDLIFLDVEMPGLNGLDLCARIRKMATNRATPVVFVTGHSDFATWAKSSLSGGNDFIAKPFLSVELALKALVWLFKGRVQPLSTATPADMEDRLAENEPARSNAAIAVP
jgi:CheY-like chemotaxis protein